jgi:starch phosphorylase
MKNRPETKQSLVKRYDCGPVKLSGDSNAFYERHVTFDHVVAETETSARDMLSKRWLKTRKQMAQ